MKTHLNFATRDLDKSVAFYSALLGATPAKVLPDYALFITEQPGLELALDRRSSVETGSDAHYGVCVESASDVDTAIAFYRDNLGFTEIMHPASTFAMMSLGDMRLVLTAPGGGRGGGQAMPDGRVQEPGGWNRFAIEVQDLSAMVARLRDAGAHFRNDIVTGVGGKQIIVDDPSGNPVELFEPVLAEARLSK